MIARRREMKRERLICYILILLLCVVLILAMWASGGISYLR